MAKNIKSKESELLNARKQLAAQQAEIEKLKAELIKANERLLLQEEEKRKRAVELGIANKELVFEDAEKGKRAAELEIANIELIYQNTEKQKRAEELTLANKELAYQNKEKEKRAAELTIANIELAYQNEEKEKRAEELMIANKKLIYENKEKEKRAAELSIANRELAYQNKEKEKRAAELSIANIELAYQNDEKEKRAAELIVANEQLLIDYQEKEKRAAELIILNKELSALTFISSHDLQEPLRKIETFGSQLLEEENKNLSEKGRRSLQRIGMAAKRMRLLINDLLTLSHISTTKLKFEKTDLNVLIKEVKIEFADIIREKQVTIEANILCCPTLIKFQVKQLLLNLISNAIKFSKAGVPPHITISSSILNSNELNNQKLQPDKSYYLIVVKDNGIGFDPRFSERIFEVFQKFHTKELYGGTGMGLAVVKKIVENHNGIITATSELNIGSTIEIYIPQI